MDRKALPFYIPGIILFLWGGIWGATGFYTSQTWMVIGLIAGGALLLWLGQRTQAKAADNGRPTFGEK